MKFLLMCMLVFDLGITPHGIGTRTEKINDKAESVNDMQNYPGYEPEYQHAEEGIIGDATSEHVTEEQEPIQEYVGVYELTAYAESYSNHPIALSIKKAYDKSIDKNKISEISEIAGNGVRAEINGCSILVGNENLLKNHNISYQKANETGTIVYTAKNSKFLGHIVISDKLKEDAQKAIIELKKLKLQTVMLTGDTEESGLAVAKELNIDKAYTQLLPIDKVDKIEDIIEQKTKNKSVIFVGDGINDAPVLTRADVGIAMGGLGSDAAIEAADVVIMDDKPTKVATAIKIAKQTLTIVKENIAFALGIKVLFLILGAFGFVTMWGAVFADVGVTLIAVLNSLRALKIK